MSGQGKIREKIRQLRFEYILNADSGDVMLFSQINQFRLQIGEAELSKNEISRIELTSEEDLFLQTSELISEYRSLEQHPSKKLSFLLSVIEKNLLFDYYQQLLQISIDDNHIMSFDTKFDSFLQSVAIGKLKTLSELLKKLVEEVRSRKGKITTKTPKSRRRGKSRDPWIILPISTDSIVSLEQLEILEKTIKNLSEFLGKLIIERIEHLGEIKIHYSYMPFGNHSLFIQDYYPELWFKVCKLMLNQDITVPYISTTKWYEYLLREYPEFSTDLFKEELDTVETENQQLSSFFNKKFINGISQIMSTNLKEKESKFNKLNEESKLYAGSNMKTGIQAIIKILARCTQYPEDSLIPLTDLMDKEIYTLAKKYPLKEKLLDYFHEFFTELMVKGILFIPYYTNLKVFHKTNKLSEVLLSMEKQFGEWEKQEGSNTGKE